MGLTSLQVCMDSTDWLQGTIHEESGMDSSSPSGDMLTCSRPLIERRLRPPHDQALKCPRCDSTHTKFCYYNNYSLSQPRYFCKTCRRYWTKGGTLRNIPVGGGCRKNKKVSTKKSNNNNNNNTNNDNQPINHINPSSSSSSLHVHNNIINPTDLHLSFPDQIQISHLNHLLTTQGTLANPTFGPIDFMESKLEAIVGSSRNSNYDFMGNGDVGMVNGFGEINNHHHHHHGLTTAHPNFPFGISSSSSLDDGNSNNSNGNFMETCQRLMVPYGHHHHHHQEGNEDQTIVDVKPNTKLLSLEWQDQGCSDNGKDTFGYLNHLGSWTGMINGYGSSTATNPLV